jgi:transcriptional regulator with XRE-family HTH domain
MQDIKADSEQRELDPRIIKMAAKLRELRIKKGYSNHEFFAWDNEIGRAQYWKVEKGSNITIKTVLKILDIHGVSLSEFFKEM